MAQIDIVTVYHNEKNFAQTLELRDKLFALEGDRVTFCAHSNMEDNLGFAKACNLAAAEGVSPIIGFLNPDVVVEGPFVSMVIDAIDAGASVVGNRFGKPQEELKIWGVKEWVCGAVFFINRSLFELLGGFDERFVWSFEETDLIRRVEGVGGIVRPLGLPIRHSSPTEDTPADSEYKRKHFAEAQQYYYAKWKGQ